MIITKKKELLGNEFYCKPCRLILRDELKCPCGNKTLILASLADIKWCRMCENELPENGSDTGKGCGEYYGELLSYYKLLLLTEN